MSPSLSVRLAGKVAILTGGAAGLGLAYALRFVAEGLFLASEDSAFMTGQTRVVDGGSVFV